LPKRSLKLNEIDVGSRPSLIQYHPHQRCEVILLNYTGGPQIPGVNITGYNENPRGDISFKFSFPRRDRDTGPAAPETEAQVQAEIRAYDCYGTF